MLHLKGSTAIPLHRWENRIIGSNLLVQGLRTNKWQRRDLSPICSTLKPLPLFPPLFCFPFYKRSLKEISVPASRGSSQTLTLEVALSSHLPAWMKPQVNSGSKACLLSCGLFRTWLIARDRCLTQTSLNQKGNVLTHITGTFQGWWLQAWLDQGVQMVRKNDSMFVFSVLASFSGSFYSPLHKESHQQHHV